MSGNLSLILFAGKFEQTAMPRLQLTAASTFDLKIGGETYQSLLESTLTATAKVASFQFAPTLPEQIKAAQLRDYLDSHVPNWRSLHKIVFYPTQLYFFRLADLDVLFRKLCAVSNATVIRNRKEIVALDPETLLHMPPDHYLSDLLNASVLTSDDPTTDLNKWNGLFDISKTQTSSRSFNSFSEQLPYLRKFSREKSKCKAEFEYLAQVPADIRAFFPQVGCASEEADGFSYDIEFLTMFDLGRFLIHGALDRQTTEAVLRNISRYITLLPRKKASSEDFKARMRALFITKLRSRLKVLRNLDLYPRLDLLARSAFKGGIDHLESEIVEALEMQIQSLHDDEVAMIHGDLCFSNILYDRLTDRIKLIDPRGAADRSELMQPIYYDLAKLSHSFLGGYDLIMNGLATTEIDSGLILSQKFEIDEKYWTSINQQFKAWLIENKWNYSLIRLGEASLFLSMLPLHQDDPARVTKQLIASVAALKASNESKYGH